MPRLKKSIDDHYRVLAIAAARLAADGKNQKAITGHLKAKQRKLTQPGVSRLLRFAKEENYLSKHPVLLRANIDDELWRRADQVFFIENRISKTSSRPPKGVFCEVRVFNGNERQLTFAVAGHLLHLLQRSHRVGVMWGRTLLEIVKSMRERGNEPEASGFSDVQCIPLCGDPAFLMNQREVEYSASHLAANLSSVLSGQEHSDLPCLTGVPAYISRVARSQASKANSPWLEYFQQIPGYRKIFTGDHEAPPLVNDIDTILTGVGVITEKRGPDHLQRMGGFIRERLEQEPEITLETLGRVIYGDIGGLLMPKQNLTTSDRRLVHDLNEGWTGIRRDIFESIARRAHGHGVPGVVVIAFGREKAILVHQLITAGLVNQVLIDDDLCRGLMSA